MSANHTQKKLILFFKKNTPVLLMAAILLCVGILSSGGHASAGYALSGAAGSAPGTGAGYATELTDRIVYLHEEAPAVSLEAGTQVLIRINGGEITAQAQEETISALLKRLEMVPGPLDTILVDSSGDILTLSIGREPVGYVQMTESIAYESVRVANPDLPLGQERVTQTGVNGTRTSCYAVTFFNGKEASRQLTGESVIPAVEEIIEYGTAAETLNSDDRIADVQTNEDGSGLLTFDSGATLKFASVKSVTATAYTAGRGGAGYITASGTPARPGAVAVDRRVIPLGSKLYIVTDDGKYVYGLAVAEDTGVIGNRVDLYYDDYDECIIFGRRAATIYILED